MIQDKDLKSAMDRLGFCKLNFASQDLIQELNNIYQEFYGGNEATKDLSASHNGQELNKALLIHQKLSAAIQSSLDEKFQNYKVIASHFVVKRAKSEASFQLHQDWNITEESKFDSYKIWLPLQASYPENGGICFIPESHQFFDNYRSGSLGIPMFPIEERLYPYLSYLRMFPGEAAVFHNSTIHGSFINSTVEDRVVVLINIIEKDATPLYFHKEEENLILAQEVSTESLFEKLYLLEKGVKLDFESFNYSFEHAQKDNSLISNEDLIELIHKTNAAKGRHEDYEHKMFSILKSEDLEKEINKQGFSIINFLDEATLEKFRVKFNEVYPDRTQFTGLYSSMMNVAHEKRKELHDFTITNLKPCIEKFAENYASPISLFYSRRPDKEYYLEWHSDPSIMLNQHLEPLYGIWFPLVDLEPENGTLKIIPGSHRLLNKLLFTYNTFKWSLEDKRALLEEYGIRFRLKAGQALIYDARMIHSSDPNYSEVDRDNVMIRLNHLKSNYFRITSRSVTENHAASLYKQDKDFFFSKAVKEHDMEPETGEYMGKMHLFYEDTSREKIASFLDKYKSNQEVLSL